ncbi:helix-turn-helix domain-containing protein [Skermania sp. ID1734]|nr:helix-turn-helix domain-containing protein [Skermania sp. ID1734]
MIVRARRARLGMTHDDVRAAGGPSDRLMTKIEHGQGPEPSPSTLRKIDCALRWQPGSAAAVLGGEDPRPLEDARPTRADIDRHDRLLSALERRGVTHIAMRGAGPADDGHTLAPELVEEIIALLNELPMGPRPT